MLKRMQKIAYVILALLLLGGSFFAGAYYSFTHRSEIEKVYVLTHKEPEVATSVDFTPFWKVWNILNEKSPSSKNISDQEKVWGAVQGLASSMDDPYTVFFPPDESKAFEDSISGQFGGVGMEVGIKDKILTVIAPLKDTPAYKAGIKSGDKILKIDKKSSADLTIEKAIMLIRGEKGTTVTLTIFKEGEKDSRDVSIVRDTIEIPTLDSELRKEDGVFVIKLYSFSANSAILFQTALQKFADSGSNKLILDLRGDPGGYLDSAVSMASWFLPGGKPILIEDYGDKEKEKIYRSRGYDVFAEGNLKMVILVDGGSASASEILAGALSEHGVAKLVGTQTYGKGSVQEVVPITDTTSLKVTIAKWYTPNGVSISEKGLTPDFIVKFTQKDADAKKDPQMDKALEIVNK